MLSGTSCCRIEPYKGSNPAWSSCQWHEAQGQSLSLTTTGTATAKGNQSCLAHPSHPHTPTVTRCSITNLSWILTAQENLCPFCHRFCHAIMYSLLFLQNHYASWTHTVGWYCPPSTCRVFLKAFSNLIYLFHFLSHLSWPNGSSQSADNLKNI